MIVEVLTESFPVTALLILISAAGRGGCCGVLVVHGDVVVVAIAATPGEVHPNFLSFSCLVLFVKDGCLQLIFEETK